MEGILWSLAGHWFIICPHVLKWNILSFSYHTTVSLLVERLGLWGVGMIVAQLFVSAFVSALVSAFVAALVYWKLQSFVMPAADLHGWGIINYIIFN